MMKLAASESKSIQIYASLGDTELNAVLKSFTQTYGIKVQVLDAESEALNLD